MGTLRVTWRGHEFSFPVSDPATTTVGHIRHELFLVTGVPPDRQTLLLPPPPLPLPGQQPMTRRRNRRPRYRTRPHDQLPLALFLAGQHADEHDENNDDDDDKHEKDDHPHPHHHHHFPDAPLTMIGTPPSEHIPASTPHTTTSIAPSRIAEPPEYPVPPISHRSASTLNSHMPVDSIPHVPDSPTVRSSYNRQSLPTHRLQPPTGVDHQSINYDDDLISRPQTGDFIEPSPVNNPRISDPHQIVAQTPPFHSFTPEEGILRQSQHDHDQNPIFHFFGEEIGPQGQLPVGTSPNGIQAVAERPASYGAALRLEEMDDMLAGATCGTAFVDKHLTGAVPSPSRVEIIPEQRFMKAIVRAKADLKLLVVLVLQMGHGDDSTIEGSGTEDEDFTDAGSRNMHTTRDMTPSVLSSSQLIFETLAQDAVVEILREHFVVYAADVGPLPDHGAALLHRLGLPTLPLLLVLSDVGSGVSIVDMFAADDVGVGAPAADAILTRLLDLLGTYEGFYELARARRVASEAREDIISEQDAAFQHAQAEDRARAHAAELARAEAEQQELELKLEEENLARAIQEDTSRAFRALPAEPIAGGARIAIRLPDGRREDRRFEKNNVIGDIFNWCVSLGLRCGSFQLRLSYPRQTFTVEHDHALTIEVAGLVPTATLNVDLL